MNEGYLRARGFVGSVRQFLRQQRNHTIAGVLIFFWCLCYFTTGQKVEWGDFSFFAQAYEAMRVSIIHYHQFPWWNPWMSGGVPLYANPQMGVFSIQMVFVLIFGAPLGLKIALAAYTVLGYASMYWLMRKYFSVEKMTSTLVSLIWIFCSFFISHLPSHVTFAWYMLAPFFIYLALTVRGWRGGLLLGGAFAIMAQSQIHNPFFHIALLVGLISACRLIIEKNMRKALLVCIGTAILVFCIFAGNRVFFTVQNVHEFPRFDLQDPAPSALADFLGPIAPSSANLPYHFIQLPQAPASPWGFNEVSATIGISALIAGLVSLLYLAHNIANSKEALKRRLIAHKIQLILLIIAAICLVLAYGRFSRYAPYNILKHLPIFGQMRVSTRWFIFFDLAVLIFIAITIQRSPQKSFYRFTAKFLLVVGVIELFSLNVGYQRLILTHTPIKPTKASWQYPFEQTSYFGQTRKLSDGATMTDDGFMPHAYREYEATLYNEGILYANDSLVQLALDPRRDPGHPTCPVEEGCSFVKSHNATVTYWSPNKIVLKRTAPGAIYLNANNSSYFVINGKRDGKIRVAEPFTDFVIKDSTSTITITVRPSILSSIRSHL